MTSAPAKLDKKSVSKAETEVIEMIRTLTHLPLGKVEEVLKGLATCIAIQYADILDAQEEGDREIKPWMVIPYIGVLRVGEGETDLLIEWDKNSLALHEMINVKRAVKENDNTLIEMWYNRLREDLKEKI